jgi:hypothetical protein
MYSERWEKKLSTCASPLVAAAALMMLMVIADKRERRMTAKSTRLK